MCDESARSSMVQAHCGASPPSYCGMDVSYKVAHGVPHQQLRSIASRVVVPSEDIDGLELIWKQLNITFGKNIAVLFSIDANTVINIVSQEVVDTVR